MTNASLSTPSVASAPNSTPAIGGAKRSKTSQSKACAKQGGMSSSAKSSKSTKSKKQGGALVDDIKNLAVPFAILLAKQGLSTMFEKKSSSTATKKPAASKKATPAAAKPASASRRKTATGGSACTSGCGMTGGSQKAKKAVQAQFDSIAKEIESFLHKY